MFLAALNFETNSFFSSLAVDDPLDHSQELIPTGRGKLVIAFCNSEILLHQRLRRLLDQAELVPGVAADRNQGCIVSYFDKITRQIV